MCTLVFNQSLHRKLWLYIAEHCIEKTCAILQMHKDGLLTRRETKTLLESKNYCLTCAYAEEMRYHGSIGECECCPFVGMHSVQEKCLRGTFTNFCLEMHMLNGRNETTDYYAVMLDGEYFAVRNNKTSQEQHRKLCAMYARAIANWPVRDNVDCV